MRCSKILNVGRKLNLVVNPKIVTSKDHLRQRQNIGPVLVTPVMETLQRWISQYDMFLGYANPAIGYSEIRQGTGASSNFNQLIHWQHHMKDLVKSSHLTKFDAFRMNSVQVIDLESLFKMHANVCNVETYSAPPQTILTLQNSYDVFGTLKNWTNSFFQMVGEWWDFTVVTNLINILTGRCSLRIFGNGL